MHLKIYYSRLMIVEKDEMSEEKAVSGDVLSLDAASLKSLFEAADHE